MTSFAIPQGPALREQYDVTAKQVPSGKRGWPHLNVRVYKVNANKQRRRIARYQRMYPSFFNTFEPFRQGDKHFALVSVTHPRTSVLDLATGKIIAEEDRSKTGFCPTDFYVPDWWDIHDGSITPGSKYWDDSMERPNGSFGFVAGCEWGDDTSWKVQYLDLSRISEGIISRDERFGYLELPPRMRLKDAVTLHENPATVSIATNVGYDLATGVIHPYYATSLQERFPKDAH